MKEVTICFDYVGKSTESKPADAPDGSVFYEVDTKLKYVIYNGEWYQM